MIRLGQFLRKHLVSLFRSAPQESQTAPRANEDADDQSNKDSGPKPVHTTFSEDKVNPNPAATGIAESVQAFPPFTLTNLANERAHDSKRATDAETPIDVPADSVQGQLDGTVTHAGQPEDMVSRPQDALIQPSKLPSDSTTLRTYLESTSVKVPSSPKLSPTRQTPQPRQVPSPRVSSPRYVSPQRPSVSPNRHSVSPRPSSPRPSSPSPNPTPTRKSSTSIKGEPASVRPSSPKKNVEIKEPTKGTSETVEKNAEAPYAPEDEVGIVAFIEVSASTKEVVGRTMQKLGMKELTTEGYWNVRWSDNGATIQVCQKLQKFQKINRFPGGGLLMMKNNLAKETAKMKAYFPDDYDFVPETWCLSGEMKKVEMYAAAHEGDCFIVKPNDGSSGKGIIITRSIARLKTCDKMVCQVYIRQPYLIDGFKFDLRVYTLITSCMPLRLFVYNEGLARFATEPYEEPNAQNESNKFMHLTNYAVNKRSPSYLVCEMKGTLRRLSTINKWLLKHNIDAKKVWDSMDDAIIKTIISFLPALKHNYRVSFPDQNDSNSCFQILGFDIIFDDNLKPYVLEVNDSPSLKADVPLDQEMTDALILDTFNILHLDENNRSKVLMEEKRASRQRLLSSSMQIRNGLQKEKEKNEQALTQSRIAWEDTHMGNFRKVYPLTSDRKMKHYKKFIREAQAIFTNHV